MKTLSAIFATSALLALTACGSLGTQYGYVDDVYYNPANAAQQAQADQFSKTPTLTKEQQQASNAEFNRLRNQYESKQTQNPNANVDELQQQYAQILGNDTIAEADTLLYFNDETGYWVNEFQGSDMDRDYAERIAKFHGPFRGIPYWSPFYNDIVYSYNPYWNVYVDGNYAYMFPSWSNPYYSNYYASPSWSFSFGWNYGWGYNYWGYNRWGFGFYDPWYDPWYGWNSPYYWGSPWHHHHYYGGGWAGGGSYNRVHAPRYGHVTGRGQSSEGSSTSRSAASQYSGTTRSAYRSSGVSSYSSRTQQPASGDLKNQTGTDGEQRTTRRSYTPTYNRTESSSTPSYNRPAAPRQGSSITTGTGSTRPQATTPSSGTQATPQRSGTYNGSTYRPSGNSSYRSTSTPSSSSGSSSRQSSYSTPSSSSSSTPSTYSAPRSSSSSGSYTPSSSGSSSGGSTRSYSGGGSSSSGSSSGGSSGGSRSSSGGGGSSRR